MENNIELLALKKGMRLAQLAREVGVTPECLYKWKRVGIETARLGTLARIADVLGCKVDDVFD